MNWRLLLSLGMVLWMMQPAIAGPEGIGWIPSWEQGLAEAKKSNKPILVTSAAPQCGGISGLW